MTAEAQRRLSLHFLALCASWRVRCPCGNAHVAMPRMPVLFVCCSCVVVDGPMPSLLIISPGRVRAHGGIPLFAQGGHEKSTPKKAARAAQNPAQNPSFFRAYFLLHERHFFNKLAAKPRDFFWVSSLLITKKTTAESRKCQRPAVSVRRIWPRHKHVLVTVTFERTFSLDRSSPAST